MPEENGEGTARTMQENHLKNIFILVLTLIPFCLVSGTWAAGKTPRLVSGFLGLATELLPIPAPFFGDPTVAPEGEVAVADAPRENPEIKCPWYISGSVCCIQRVTPRSDLKNL